MEPFGKELTVNRELEALELRDNLWDDLLGTTTARNVRDRLRPLWERAAPTIPASLDDHGIPSLDAIAESAELAAYVTALDGALVHDIQLTKDGRPVEWARARLHELVVPEVFETAYVRTERYVDYVAAVEIGILITSQGATINLYEKLRPDGVRLSELIPSMRSDGFNEWDAIAPTVRRLIEQALPKVRAHLEETPRVAVRRPSAVQLLDERCKALARALTGRPATSDAERQRLARLAKLIGIDPPRRRRTLTGR